MKNLFVLMFVLVSQPLLAKDLSFLKVTVSYDSPWGSDIYVTDNEDKKYLIREVSGNCLQSAKLALTSSSNVLMQFFKLNNEGYRDGNGNLVLKATSKTHCAMAKN